MLRRYLIFLWSQESPLPIKVELNQRTGLQYVVPWISRCLSVFHCSFNYVKKHHKQAFKAISRYIFSRNIIQGFWGGQYYLLSIKIITILHPWMISPLKRLAQWAEHSASVFDKEILLYIQKRDVNFYQQVNFFLTNHLKTHNTCAGQKTNHTGMLFLLQLAL